MSSTTSGLKRKCEDALMQPKREKTISLSISNILDIPDEILRKIILLLNARERLPLGNTCQRFKELVFEDIELLRDLDFSKDVHLTSATDIQQYFNNESTLKHVLRLNVRNVSCIKSGHLLNDSIGKAVNLVDINIHGLQFKDIWQLGSFLNPFICVQRLSVDWPEMKKIHISLCFRVMQKPFSRLVYLSVEMNIDLLKMFIPYLRLCHKLRKLRMVVQKPSDYSTYTDIWGGKMKGLRNLEIIEYCGPFAIQIKELLVTILQDPEKWADFQLNSVGDPKGFYLEKNVEVCEKLLASEWTERAENPACNNLNLRWTVFPECLLTEVLKLNYQDMPEEFCCLKRCFLKLEDVKGLLKNPRHQISYLRINHAIELGCDVHLVASAFSNLTELVLSSVTRKLEQSLRGINFQRRRKRCASAVLGEECDSLNLDSSFKMLVQNTPYLRHLTLDGAGYQSWDLDELHLISSWKSLETLRLLSIPIEDGHFLIEIGKQCKNLQKLELFDLGRFNDTYCYEKELPQMLQHCKTLRDFSITVQHEKCIRTVSVFTLLANNRQLRNVSIKDLQAPKPIEDLMSSIRQLLLQCPELTTFAWHIRDTSYPKHPLSLGLERLLNEISRPSLQIAIFARLYGGNGRTMVGTIHQDAPHSNPFSE